MRILGVDPALRNTGYGVIEVQGVSKMKVISYGVIRTGDKIRQSECLMKIRTGILAVLDEFQPETAAVEGIIYLQSFSTAITLGAARGATLIALSERNLPIFEYAPRKVKSAATGRGGAQKHQIGFMMRALLGLTEAPPADAADALAIALTHAQSRPGISEGKRL